MKHRWTTLLWELWAAQALCAVAALPPGSAFHTCPALKARAKGVIKKNTASRKSSRMAKRANKNA